MRTLLSGTGVLGVSVLLVLTFPIERAQRAGASGTDGAGRHRGPARLTSGPWPAAPWSLPGRFW